MAIIHLTTEELEPVLHIRLYECISFGAGGPEWYFTLFSFWKKKHDK